MDLQIFHDKSDDSLLITRRAFIYVFFLFMFWITAWLFAITLEQSTTLLSTSQNRFFYWFFIKILIWILPSCYLIKSTGKTVSEVMNVKRFRLILLWGGGIGSIIALVSIGSNVLLGHTFGSFEISWSFISAVIVAPIFEEFTFRGGILGSLMTRYTFLYANLITALLFLGIHLPGWYFNQVLFKQLLDPIGGALPIFLLGFVFGFVSYKSKSVTSGMLAHFLNNLSNVL